MRSFAFGTLGDRKLDMRDICAGGAVSRVEVVPTAGTVAIGIFSLGFYTPRRVLVTCAGHS